MKSHSILNTASQLVTLVILSLSLAGDSCDPTKDGVNCGGICVAR
jgi:hypothetical protein